MRLALLGSVALLVVAVGAFYAASRIAHLGKGAEDDAHLVTIEGGGCTPDSLSVPAGVNRFRIVNRSERAVEWEILDGVMVVEERENIAPGFTQSLSANLRPGDYAITCGLLSNPRGTLHVTPTAASEAARAAQPSLTDFIGALAEYRVYLITQATALDRNVKMLAAAIESGDLDAARAAWGPARLPYKRIEPVADMFSDLDTRLDARADYFEKREADPAFTGFHRLEYGLFAQGSLEGLAPVAAQLTADVEALRQRLGALTVPPERMASGALKVTEEMASLKITGEEDRYAHADLDAFAGNLDGVEKAVTLLLPFVARKDQGLAAAINGDLTAAKTALAAFGAQGSFPSYETVPQTARDDLGGRFSHLAVDLRKIAPTLGFQ